MQKPDEYAHGAIFHDIETERLYLRGISAADRDFIFRQFSDADVSRYLFDEEPFTEIEEADGLIEFYTQPEPRNQHRWIITAKTSGERLGTCGFHCWDRDAGRCELGYDLYPAFRGEGYMREALDAILRFAGDEMEVREVDACIYPENERSVNAAVKLGFVRSGREKVYVFRGKEYAHHIYTKTL